MGTSPFGTPGFIVLTGSVSQEVRHDRVGWFIFISVVSGGLGGNNWKHSADKVVCRFSIFSTSWWGRGLVYKPTRDLFRIAVSRPPALFRGE